MVKKQTEGQKCFRMGRFAIRYAALLQQDISIGFNKITIPRRMINLGQRTEMHSSWLRLNTRIRCMHFGFQLQLVVQVCMQQDT